MKRIMATASLTMPSPNTKEKSFGCSSYLIIEIAAMTSEEQSRELITKHSAVDKTNYYQALAKYELVNILKMAYPS